MKYSIFPIFPSFLSILATRFTSMGRGQKLSGALGLDVRTIVLILYSEFLVLNQSPTLTESLYSEIKCFTFSFVNTLSD